jgi:hypothetical protein
MAMDGRVVIRGDQLGGYGLYLSVGIIVVGAPLTALLSRVWHSRSSLLLWVISWTVMAVALVAMQVVVRRTFVEVTSDRVRWFFREPRQQGEERLTNLIRVETYPSAAVLFFNGGTGRITFGIPDFSMREVNRVVETLRSLGVRVQSGQVRTSRSTF